MIGDYGYQYFAALPLQWEAHSGEDVCQFMLWIDVENQNWTIYIVMKMNNYLIW